MSVVGADPCVCLVPTGLESALDQATEPKTQQTTINVCLVRHGETDWNREDRLQGREDIELNDRGREQARVTAAYLQRYNWNVIVTSPLKRAQETATIIAHHLGIKQVDVMPEFVQRDYGAASGLTYAEIDRIFPDNVIPRIEDRYSLTVRCMEGLNSLPSKYPSSNIVVVTHSAVIKAILGAVSGHEVNVGGRHMGNAGVSLLQFHGGTWEIESYNATFHLIPSEPTG